MTFPLNGERITVGRRPDNQIQINHGTISGHHAELLSVNGHYLLRDLDSTNHCFVDGFQVAEADLSDRCKVMIGTIECEFIPDEPGAAPEVDVDNLRKTIGLLREQNEELVGKLNDQQKQIDILGSARLLTGAAGADLSALRTQVANLTTERDRLTKENQTLKGELERLRVIASRAGEAASQKATVPIVLPTDLDATVSVGPGGSTILAAPMAKVAAPDPVVEVAPQLVEYAAKMKGLVTQLAKNPADESARAQLADVTERLAERSAVIAGHPVARLLSGLDGLARDVAQRQGPLDPSVTATLEDSVALLDKVLAPEILNRAKALPAPKILAVDSDDYLLPAIVAALDFARFQTTGCNEGEKALGLVREGKFDTVLLGVPLPGATPQDACAGLRALSNGGTVPVISLPSHGAPRPVGVNDCLEKPVNMFELTLKTNLWVLKRQLDML